MFVRTILLIYFFLPVFVFGQEGYSISDTLKADTLYLKAKKLLSAGQLEEALEQSLKTYDIYRHTIGEKTAKTADCLNLIGNVYSRNNDLINSEKYWQQALAIRREIFGDIHISVAKSYNNLGLLEASKGNYTKALKYHTQSLELKEKLVGRNSYTASTSLANIGNAYLGLQQFDKAIEAHKEALLIRQTLFGENDFRTALSYGSLGTVYLAQGRFDEPITYLQKALSIKQKIVGTDHYILAGDHNNLGVIYNDLGKYFLAIEHHNKALSIRLKVLGEKHHDTATSYNNLGLCYLEAGDYERAERYYTKALALNIQLPNHEKNLTIGENYMNLGNIYTRKGKYSKAIEYHERAIDFKLNIVDSLHSSVLSSYLNLGLAYYKDEAYEKSMECYLRVLKVKQERNYASDALSISYIYNNIALIHEDLNEYDLANEYSLLSLNMKKDLFSIPNDRVAESYRNIGRVYFKQGAFEQALKYYNQALLWLDYETGSNLAQIQTPIALFSTLISISEVYKYNYFEEGNITDLYKANDNIQQSNQIVKHFLSSSYDIIDLQETGKTKLIYDEGIRIKNLLWKVTDSLQHRKDMFALSELSKAIQLNAFLSEKKAVSIAGVPDSILVKERELNLGIAYYDKQYQQITKSEQQENSEVSLFAKNEIFDLKQQLEQLIQQIELEYPKYYQAKYKLYITTVEEVQDRLLDTNQTLLEYFIGDSTIYAFVINKNDYHIEEIPKGDLEDWVEIFQKVNEEDYVSTTVEQYTKVANQLYQKLIAPIAPKLKEKVILVPDGILGYLPFEALLVEPIRKGQEDNFKMHHYWLEDKQISYCYSATLLREMQNKIHKTPVTKTLLALAPFYNGDTSLLGGRREIEEIDQLFQKALKESGEEIYEIQKITKGTALYGKAATEEAFLKEAGNYRILHLATHGKADDKVGDYSFLIFAEQKDSLENEILYVRDLYNLQFNADMVVLSACETGIGELQKGEGIISLARGFTYAGAKSIFTSLWSVSDISTKKIMIKFYKNLVDGMEKDKALQKAKLDFIDNCHSNREAHPFFWSAFIGIGDMSGIKL